MLPRHVMNMLGNCLVILALLLTGCNAQTNSMIEVDLSDNTNRSVTIPHVNSLLITVPASFECPQNTVSDGNNKCTQTNIPGSDTYQLDFTRANTPPLVLNVTVDANRKVACKRYIFNTSVQQVLNFTCIPAVTKNDPIIVAGAVIQWRRFNNSDEMDRFINGMDTSGRSILDNTSPGDILISSSDMVTNSSIVIQSPENETRVGFYVPTVLLASGEEEQTQPFVVYIDPRITSTYEFSFIRIFGTLNFDDIHCEVESFPEATASWKRDNEPLPSHIELRSLNNITTDQLIFNFSIDGMLVFDTVQYSDGGEYNCTATNEYSEAEPYLVVRLRVHNPLRPLWPTIGIIGIVIITPLFILGGHFFDKLWGKGDAEKDGLVSAGGEKRSYSVSDSDSANNTDGHHHKAIRRVSSARQELLTDSSPV